jgi:hypothetical protein
MQRKSYKLVAETLGISDNNQTLTLVSILEGSRVTVAEAEVGSRLIDVFWEGEMLRIFVQDLDERGILEHEAKASA